MSTPLRVYRNPPNTHPVNGPEVQAALSGGGDTQFDAYYTRLIKLIPVEIVSFYTCGVALFQTRPDILWGLLAVSSVFVVVLRARLTRDETRQSKIQWGAVVISLVSFWIWAYQLGGPYTTVAYYDPQFSSFLILVWTFGVPIIFRGD